ncbi:MAG: alpha-L-fucosidase [Proteobacteria bacterium]|nr:alpha-L-fucosidase [Pseudomonadota bacterium]
MRHAQPPFLPVAFVLLSGCTERPPDPIATSRADPVTPTSVAETPSTGETRPSAPQLPYYLRGYEHHGIEPQVDETTLRASKAAYEWYRDAKFGMFIHWGIYSVEGKNEWEMEKRKWKVADYEKLADAFNPVEFDPKEWVSLAKEAGMKYIVITSKHHDGFAMWDSRISDWDIVDRTPYKKDVLKMLATESKNQGIGFGLYHSHLDWHHPDYFPRGRTGQHAGRPNSGDFNKYIDYMNAQVAELAGGDYGPISSWWFDGVWDIKEGVDWRLKETYDLIHRRLPHAMIGNNRFSVPEYGEDYQVFERDLPGHQTYKNNTTTVSSFPLESADTMNRHWGYNKEDGDFKSVKQLVHYLVRAAGIGGNLLLNVGPPPSGAFQPEVIARLRGVGKWTKQHGESIYGTRGGPMPERNWGVMTHNQEGTHSYVHLLERFGMDTLLVPVTGDIEGVTLFPSGKPVNFVLRDYLKIPLSGVTLDSTDTVFAIKHQSKLRPVEFVIGPNAKGEIVLDSANVVLEGKLRLDRGNSAVQEWKRTADRASWPLKIETAGRYRVIVEMACGKGCAGNGYLVKVGGKELRGRVRRTGSWTRFQQVKLGTVSLAAAQFEVAVEATRLRPGSALMNLRSVKLIPI